jgi:hypothetical protein
VVSHDALVGDLENPYHDAHASHLVVGSSVGIGLYVAVMDLDIDDSVDTVLVDDATRKLRWPRSNGNVEGDGQAGEHVFRRATRGVRGPACHGRVLRHEPGPGHGADGGLRGLRRVRGG